MRQLWNGSDSHYSQKELLLPPCSVTRQTSWHMSMLLPWSNYQSLPFILSTLAKETCGTRSLSPTHTKQNKKNTKSRTRAHTHTHTHTNSSSHRHKYRWEQANPLARVWKNLLKSILFLRKFHTSVFKVWTRLLLICTFSWLRSSNLCKRGFSLESDDFQMQIQV